ncbi:hypothetical protein BRD01_02725 [Halobacteriales archaeon QS_8_65_32]|nr:MAG: hypothetical protein BRD01_02725 [Halobacteriales archaeon QS_8_65_32]
MFSYAMKTGGNRFGWDWKGPTARSGRGVLASERSETSESREELCSDRVHESEVVQESGALLSCREMRSVSRSTLVSQQDRVAIL